MDIDEKPVVSVIVPVKNGAGSLDALLKALIAQSYPQDKTQIILVDNGSQDHTCDIIKRYPVVLAQENRVLGSYAARNMGLSLAQGEIIAFTDADCIPKQDWLSSGVRALIEQKADIAGGKIEFIFSERKSAAEYYDSLSNLSNERYILNKIGAVTANLFVMARLFSEIGLFPTVKSGGDIKWTGKALNKGFSLIYAPEAAVYHPTRNFAENVYKSWFRGTGMLLNLKQKSWWVLRVLYLFIRLLIPVPSKAILRSFIDVEKYPEMKDRRLAVLVISYLCQLYMFAGLVYSGFERNRNKSGKQF